MKWPQVFENFYAFGFNKYFPEEGFIELNSNTQNFIIWGNNISKNEASCNIFLLEGNIYQQQLNLDRIKFLKVNGVEPSNKTIMNGTYPLNTAYYIVTRKDNTDENVQKLFDAMLSTRGQNVAEEAGYVRVK